MTGNAAAPARLRPARFRPSGWFPSRLPARFRLPLVVYAACQVILLVWWAAFYPGRISPDTLTYLYEVTTSHWRSDHSVAYDALVWLSVRITGGIAALTLLQTVAMSALLAYVCVALRDLGVRGRWSAPAAVALAIAPSTATFTIYVWKDVAFSLASLLAFGALIQLTARRLRGAERVRDRAFRREIVLLGIGCLGIGLFRNNGFPVIMALGVLLVILLPGMRRWTAVATAVPLAAALLLNNLIYPALGVQSPRPDEVYAFNYADIGVAYAKRPGTFTAADTRLMAQVAPLSHWSGPGGDCHGADPMMAPPMNRLKAGRMNDQLMDLWFRILKRTPSLIVEARLCRADIAWSLDGHTGLYSVSNTPALKHWDKFGLHSYKQIPYGSSLRDDPLSTKLHKAATRVYEKSKKTEYQPYLWRGVSWTYLGYLIVLLLVALRRRPALLALAALPFALQVTVLVANPAPLWRYMSASLFIGVLTVPVLALLARRAPAGPRERAARTPDAVPRPPNEGDQDTAPVKG